MKKSAEKKSEKVAKKAKPVRNLKITAGNKVRREAIKNEGLDGYTNLNVRLRNAEFLEFSDQVESAGMTNNLAMRIAARRIAGFLEVDDDSKMLLREIANQITGIARNINQMAKIANTTNSVDHKGFLVERQKLGAELMRVEAVQQQLLNVGRRRQDGVRRLAEARDE